MTTRWFFILDRGLEPGETFGPARSTAAEVRAIVDAMRDHPDLADPEGTDALYGIDIDGDGIPHVTTYSGAFMNRCRAQAKR
jgi:hypothetical protein